MKNKIAKRLLSMALAVLMVLTLLPGTANAADSDTMIDLAVARSGNETYQNWTYTHSTGVYAITGDVTIAGTWSGAGQANRAVITVSGITVNITLQNAVIDVSSTANACAFAITGGATVNLTLDGNNTLKSGDNRAGLEVSNATPNNNTVVIDSKTPGGTSDTLTATGGSVGPSGTGPSGGGGAGIGGNSCNSGGIVTINGGDITANGGTAVNLTTGGGSGVGGGGGGASGIGSGSGGNITINGGRLTAKGGNGLSMGGGGAGIGGGGSAINEGGNGGNITITGGTVDATGGGGGFGGAGVGGAGVDGSGNGGNGGAGNITITGGTVNAAGGVGSSGAGAKIGGGGNQVGGAGKESIYFTSQPSPVTVTQGSSGTFTVAAAIYNDSTTTLNYQWFDNGTTNSNSGGSGTGVTTASFTIPTTLAAGTHYYYCEVSAASLNTVTSTVAVVTVNVAPPPPPPIEEEDYTPPTPDSSFTGDSTYTLGSGLDLVHTTQKGFSYFSGVKMDGKTLARDTQYKAESSSTKITLYADYLDTLSVGKHTLTVAFTDGVTVAAEFTVSPWVNPFEDVSEGDWYYGDVEYAYLRGLMTGTSAEPMLFSPYTPITRGMIVTILYRLEGEPEVSTERSSGTYFTDVDQSAWYADAVAWAAENGIANGYGDLIFKPEADISREQLATMLYRYVQYNGGGFTGEWMFLLQYADRDDVADWAYEAVCWCTVNGIIGGRPGNLLDPRGTATRAEAAAMLHRFLGV